MNDWEAFLGQARWFAGKGLGGRISAVSTMPWYTPAGTWPAVRSELVTVSYPDAHAETYHLLVAHRPVGTSSGAPVITALDDPELGPLEVVDAPADPESMRALVAALLDSPTMTWSDPTAVDPGARMKMFTGEQSNTTVMVGDGVLFKVFRKVEPGRNLDIEVLAALNDSPATPALYGAWSAAGFDLGYFCERVAGAEDAWEWAKASASTFADIREECTALGVALREVHDQLRVAVGIGSASGAALADAMIQRLDVACVAAPPLVPLRDSLVRSFEGLRGHTLETQRIHGDFHLGQCLLSPRGWSIIDFEGEPMKTVAERREFDSRWRDVAGMLRSFDYARTACPDPTAPEALAWASANGEAFLAGYCGDDRPPEDLLRAYITDKAIYEVVYEVRNRPGWTQIPLQAVQDEAKRMNHPVDLSKEL